MKPIYFVALGGASGALLRALISQYFFMPSQLHIAFINIIGSFLLTFLYMCSSTKINAELRLLLGVGVLGGFTTMSTFSLDIVHMILNEQWSQVWLYSVLSVVGSLLASYAGYVVAARRKGEGR